MPAKMRNSIFSLTSDSESQLWASLVEVMDYIRKGKDSVKGMDGYTIEVSSSRIESFRHSERLCTSRSFTVNHTSRTESSDSVSDY